MVIFGSLRLPRKTAASAIHPRPLEIFGTNELILIERRHPAIAPKTAQIVHAAVRHHESEMPFALRTCGSEPVILM